jgi:sodium-dependent dicarboxylate transporter 2/3/5
MAYGTGYVKIKEIVKAGIPMVVLGIILTVIIMLTIARPFIE